MTPVTEMSCSIPAVSGSFHGVFTAQMSAREKEASKKEVTLLSQMKHPNIVAFFGSFHGERRSTWIRCPVWITVRACVCVCVCAETGSLYIVMEYCDGGDLMRRINLQRGVFFTEEQVCASHRGFLTLT